MYGTSVQDFKPGDRVQLHPATDNWMRGDKYGDVVKLGRIFVMVKMDRSGRTLRCLPQDVKHVD